MLYFQTLFSQTTPSLPQAAWWLAAFVLLILAAAALIDAVKATVPDPLIFFGLFALIGMQGLYVSWPFAADNLTCALIAAAGVYTLNHLWYLVFKADAIGMGDAKWTLLAVACFGPLPALFAWGFGACLAVVWIGAAHIQKHKLTHVHFAPFLCIGLLVGLYWLRLRG